MALNSYVRSNAASISSHGHPDVAFFSPIDTPRVSDDPVRSEVWIGAVTTDYLKHE